MIKKFLFTCVSLLFAQSTLLSHCQMPCGIYHDDMVFDQIDQYIETMAKGISVMNDNKFKTVHDYNELTRWIMLKEESSDDVATVLTEFFLQQKIKPGEDDTQKKITSAHKLLFLLVAVKQNADMKILNDFYEEWERFKLMFHIEGYSCKLEQVKLKKWAAEKQRMLKEEKPGQPGTKVEDHSHDDHDHEHSHDDHDHPHSH